MTLRFGIIGCGAIVESAYIPFFKKSSIAELTCLVDNDESRYLKLSGGFNLSYVGKELEKIINHIDAVIVATPNYLHYPICKFFLEAGKHVICEKPFTTRSHECEELVNLAKKYSLKIAVAHVRRFYDAAIEIKRIIQSNELGSLHSFDFKEGSLSNWPTVSGFYFNKNEAGGGVLIDIGVHLLDMLFWWIPFKIQDFTYHDDNLGGMESFVQMEISFENGIKGSVKLSRLSVLNNCYRLHFDKGIIEWNPLYSKRYSIQDFHTKSRKVIRKKRVNSVERLISDFVNAINNNKKPFVSGEDSVDIIRFIEHCYANRKTLQLPWLQKRKNIQCI